MPSGGASGVKSLCVTFSLLGFIVLRYDRKTFFINILFKTFRLDELFLMELQNKQKNTVLKKLFY